MRKRSREVSFCALTLVISLSAWSQDFAKLPPIKNKIAVIAHRGASSQAPENTIAAIQKAIEIGADYVEVDVRETKDGHLICMHDSDVDRTTDGKGKVKKLDLADLKALDAGSWFSDDYADQEVPTFDEVLDCCKGKIHIYLDHKDGSTEKILEALKKYEMTDSVIVYNGVTELKKWKRLAPEIPIMPGLPDAYRREGGIADFLEVLPAEVLDGNLSDWNKALVDQAHEHGIEVQIDCLGIFDSPGGYRKALEYGVDGIQSNHPDRVIQVLNEPAP